MRKVSEYMLGILKVLLQLSACLTFLVCSITMLKVLLQDEVVPCSLNPVKIDNSQIFPFILLLVQRV